MGSFPEHVQHSISAHCSGTNRKRSQAFKEGRRDYSNFKALINLLLS